ncbi:lymphocyte antigen 6H-like [Monodelphis domestica]|uniref:lymphocyte antigen 6H-like n=1 Tax=Monodelphis domestica TaxID=13616 RepID=UPI00028BC9A9|nr:lymphocyte antigen 6H-like [Monodelphis domestica]XP_007488932.1 lymphocyte antigen 6H-like [Monodelphis domestica]XP_056678958.1 lymphocyte antigen 6H-like [Monodelphis domestica]
MKILISVLLGTLLFVESAQSLKCYMCIGVNDANICKAKTCSSGESFCGKIVMTPELGSDMKSYIMDCTPSCEDFKKLYPQSLGFFMDASCCNTDLCNGVGWFKGNPWALAGALLFSLGIALLWTGL